MVRAANDLTWVESGAKKSPEAPSGNLRPLAPAANGNLTGAAKSRFYGTIVMWRVREVSLPLLVGDVGRQLLTRLDRSAGTTPVNGPRATQLLCGFGAGGSKKYTLASPARAEPHYIG